MSTIKIAKLIQTKHPKVFNELINIFNSYDINFIIDDNAKDIWMRDFMPFCLDDGSLVSYVYDPNYLKNSIYDNIKTTIEPLNNHIDLIIDGGNFVRFKNRAIMTDKVFDENKKYSKDLIIAKIKSKCKLDEIIIIPKQPYDRYGHSDSLVRWVDEDTVLINDFQASDQNYKNTLFASLKDANLRVNTMQYSESFFNKYRNWGAYLNFLEFDNVIIVPIYEIIDDKLAIKQIQNYFPSKKILTINMKNIIKKGGALHCVTANC